MFQIQLNINNLNIGRSSWQINNSPTFHNLAELNFNQEANRGRNEKVILKDKTFVSSDGF